LDILGKIFSTGATELVREIGNVVDNLVTTKKEKLDAKQKIENMILGHEAKMQEEVSNRWEADMVSDSWLAKNIRPITLAFLILSTVLLIFIDAGTIDFHVEEKWTNLLQIVLITVVGAYFGGRSLEKIKK